MPKTIIQRRVPYVIANSDIPTKYFYSSSNNGLHLFYSECKNFNILVDDNLQSRFFFRVFLYNNAVPQIVSDTRDSIVLMPLSERAPITNNTVDREPNPYTYKTVPGNPHMAYLSQEAQSTPAQQNRELFTMSRAWS